MDDTMSIELSNIALKAKKHAGLSILVLPENEYEPQTDGVYSASVETFRNMSGHCLKICRSICSLS